MYQCISGLYEKYGLLEQGRQALEYREGRYSYKSLTKINFPSCKLDKKGKEKYIDDFMKNERRLFILRYLKKERVSRILSRDLLYPREMRKLFMH